MRSPLRNWLPVRLIWTIGVSNAAVSLAIVVLAVLSWHQRPTVTAKQCALAMIAIAMIADLVAESTLRKGIRLRRWPDSLLSAPRRFIEHPGVTFFIGSMFFASIAYLIVAPLRNGALATVFLVLPLSFTRISACLRPRQPVIHESSGSALYPAKPLHSDHWGAPSL